MPKSNWKPWWERVAELESAREREEFVRGVAGDKPRTTHSTILLGLVAGYIGGKAAQRKGRGK